MNIMSDQQKRQLLFAPTQNKYRQAEWIQKSKMFDIETDRYKSINRNKFRVGGEEGEDGADGGDDALSAKFSQEYWQMLAEYQTGQDALKAQTDKESSPMHVPTDEIMGSDVIIGAEEDVIMNAEDLGDPIILTDEERALIAKEEAEQPPEKKKKAKKPEAAKEKKEKKHTQFEIAGLGLLPVEYTKVTLQLH